jgi:hypothetical protein
VLLLATLAASAGLLPLENVTSASGRHVHQILAVPSSLAVNTSERGGLAALIKLVENEKSIELMLC